MVKSVYDKYYIFSRLALSSFIGGIIFFIDYYNGFPLMSIMASAEKDIYVRMPSTYIIYFSLVLGILLITDFIIRKED